MDNEDVARRLEQLVDRNRLIINDALPTEIDVTPIVRLVASFYNGLVERGLPHDSATTLTSAYIVEFLRGAVARASNAP